MPEYCEIDFCQVHMSKSGDAIGIRYPIGQNWSVHLVDGGYATTAPEIAQFIRGTYGTDLINHVVVTHPDRDHAEGLAPILEEFRVGTLWMLRPWDYAAHHPLHQGRLPRTRRPAHSRASAWACVASSPRWPSACCSSEHDHSHRRPNLSDTDVEGPNQCSGERRAMQVYRVTTSSDDQAGGYRSRALPA